MLEDPRGLVEQLEALVLLAFGHIRLVRKEDSREWQDQEPQQDRVDPHHRDGEEREARVGDRHHAAELDHLGQLLELGCPARDRDDGRDREGAHEGCSEGRRERGKPVDEMRLTAHIADRVEHRQLDHRDEREVGQVEHDLLDPLAAADHECDRRADEQRYHVVERRQEEEADDCRELAEGEGVGLAAEMDLDDLELGGGERDRQDGPRQRELCRRGREIGKLAAVDKEGKAGEDG